MTRKETLEILAQMRAMYPRFYQTIQSNEDIETTIKLWHEVFEQDDFEIVKLAIKQLLTKLEFPPTIADVKKEIKKLTSVATDEPTNMDEWNAIRKAIKNSAYGAKEEFEKLPPIAKKFVGSPAQLRDWAIATDFNDGVVRGQFLKQYDVLKEKERYAALLPDNVKNLLRDAAPNLLQIKEG